jgi:predicted nuclease with TOPRIM domain
VRIKTAKLDSIFSERLLYRVGEALRNSGEYPMDDQDTKQFENRRREIHEALIEQLQEAAKPESELPDPLKTLRASIDETKERIAEKERVSEAATDVMSVEDLRKHFESLKKLRRSLAEMERKLERAEAEEQDQEEAKGKLPEVYERWHSMPIAAKQRFIRVATARVTLDEIVTSWLKLTVEWSPVVGKDLMDEVYIWTTAGKGWTDKEKDILREHYATASRDWLMEQLPDRSWDTIAAKGQELGIKRLHIRYQKCILPDAPISINDWKFVQENELPLEEMLAKRAYWKEYVSFPIKDNRERESKLC